MARYVWGPSGETIQTISMQTPPPSPPQKTNKLTTQKTTTNS